jgi:dolichol-phosphate mannosyltransferase
LSVELSIVVPTLNERANVEPLVAAVTVALAGISWELIVVDDDSADGTAEAVEAIGRTDTRVRCLRRIGRRGLAGACIEGGLAAAGSVVAVMDADLQHDPAILPRMLERLRSSEVDLVVGSRYVAGGSAPGLSAWRMLVSRCAATVARCALGLGFSDTTSGFFMLRRDLVAELAPRLSRTGFKILVDIAASAGRPLRIEEIGFRFGPRAGGASKCGAAVGVDFIRLVAARAAWGLGPHRAG